MESIMVFLGMDFNPRSREGSDKNGHMYGDIGFLISIHAPAKGATIFDRFFINAILFQSTLPRRERPFILPEFCYFLYFNPRSREGSDHCRSVLILQATLFQSTLPRRERLSNEARKRGYNIFQSTLPRRERRGLLRFCRDF